MFAEQAIFATGAAQEVLVPLVLSEGRDGVHPIGALRLGLESGDRDEVVQTSQESGGEGKSLLEIERLGDVADSANTAVLRFSQTGCSRILGQKQLLLKSRLLLGRVTHSLILDSRIALTRSGSCAVNKALISFGKPP